MIEKMINTAKNKLNEITKGANGLPEPQVTVLLSDNDKVYVAVNDIEGLICEKLKNENATKIVRMITMWKDGGVDLPSVTFRNALVKMDEYNKNTEVVLQGKDGYLIKKLSVTMP
jgi:hypothetical protein